MPLYNQAQGGRLVDPVKTGPLHSIPVSRIQQFYKSKPQSFDKMVRTISEAIRNEKPSKSSQLVWTRIAKMFGEGSQNPHSDVELLWERVGAVFGHDKKWTGIGVGSLMYWQTACVPDNIWLCDKVETGGYDYQDEKDITYMMYWIDNTYAPPPPKGGPLNLGGLKDRWGATIR